MATRSRAAQLEKQIGKLRRELGQIRDVESQKKLEALRNRCFRYSNTYGGERAARWWKYLQVTSIGDGEGTCLMFEATSTGVISIEPREQLFAAGFSPATPGNGWEEIAPAELRMAWKNLLSRIAEAGPA